jgi:hypothetical protein
MTAFAVRSIAVWGGVTRSGWYVGDAGNAVWVVAALVRAVTPFTGDSDESLSARSTATTNTAINGAAINNFTRADRHSLIS